LRQKAINFILILGIAFASVIILYWRITIESESDNANQPSIITSYYPLINPQINETEIQEFNISAIDPDGEYLTFGRYLNGTGVSGNLTSFNYSIYP
jgi:hypothetical protein